VRVAVCDNLFNIYNIILNLYDECFICSSKCVVVSPAIIPIHREFIHRTRILLKRVGLKISVVRCFHSSLSTVHYNFDIFSFLCVIFFHDVTKEQQWRVGNSTISSYKKWNDTRTCVILSHIHITHFVPLLKLDDDEFFCPQTMYYVYYLSFVFIVVG